MRAWNCLKNLIKPISVDYCTRREVCSEPFGAGPTYALCHYGNPSVTKLQRATNWRTSIGIWGSLWAVIVPKENSSKSEGKQLENQGFKIDAVQACFMRHGVTHGQNSLPQHSGSKSKFSLVLSQWNEWGVIPESDKLQ